MTARICMFCRRKVRQYAYSKDLYLGWHRNADGNICAGSDKNIQEVEQEISKQLIEAGKKIILNHLEKMAKEIDTKIMEAK